MSDDHPERERDDTSDDQPTDPTSPADPSAATPRSEDTDDADGPDDATPTPGQDAPGDRNAPDDHAAPDDRSTSDDRATFRPDARADDVSDQGDDEAFGSAEFDPDDPLLEDLGLDDHDIEHIQRDLDDLADFESAFRPEGYRGVAVWCQDCAEEHFYPWDMLRENLQVLLETGETPVHEPAFAPEPERYVPWDYARGYVDALRDAGVDQRLDVAACPRCRLPLDGEAAQANYCPRCAAPLLAPRLLAALTAHGVEPARIDAILRETGLPG